MMLVKTMSRTVLRDLPDRVLLYWAAPAACAGRPSSQAITAVSSAMPLAGVGVVGGKVQLGDRAAVRLPDAAGDGKAGGGEAVVGGHHQQRVLRQAPACRE